jgi:prolipoprotein diacylglyceryltransferase
VLQDRFGIEVDPALVERFGQVVPVHPTQLYEIAMVLVIFVILWRLRLRERAPSWLFWLCLVLLSTERFVVEMVRVKDDRFLGPLTIAQLIAVGLILLGLWGMHQASSRAGASKGAAA